MSREVKDVIGICLAGAALTVALFASIGFVAWIKLTHDLERYRIEHTCQKGNSP